MRRSERDRSREGQALIEGVLALLMVAPVLAGGFLLLRGEWSQLRCSRDLFERTRAALSGAPSQTGIGETPEAVQGVARCGNRIERIRFLKLERSQ